MLPVSSTQGYVSLATAVLVVAGHLLAARDRKRKAVAASETLQTISVNVDGRLDAALADIADLREQLGAAKAAPAELVPAAALPTVEHP